MKKILLIALLLIVGCSKEPINYKGMLVKRDGTYVTRDTRKPYSGPVFSLFSDGQKASEGTLKNGVFDGMYSEWFDESGGVKVRGMYINGKKDGLWEYGSEYFPSTFYSAVAPEMFSVRSYRSGVIEWDNGRKVSERYWDKDGNRD